MLASARVSVEVTLVSDPVVLEVTLVCDGVALEETLVSDRVDLEVTLANKVQLCSHIPCASVGFCVYPDLVVLCR